MERRLYSPTLPNTTHNPNGENVSPCDKQSGPQLKAPTTYNIQSPEIPSPILCDDDAVKVGDGISVGKRLNLDEHRTILGSIDIPSAIKFLRSVDFYKLNRFHIFVLFATHPLALVGIYNAWHTAMWRTLIFNYFFFAGSALGVTMGMHRLWSHKSYSAHPIVEYVLTFWATASAQYSVIHWCRDHRAHHKYSETPADPHNAAYGLFFSHMGWLLLEREEASIKAVEEQDMSDLENKPHLRFQDDYYFWLVVPAAFIIPTLFSHYAFGESLFVSLTICMLRVCCTWHETFCVNSIAHWEGAHPYDQTIWPVDNFIISFICFGEGWHNFHHSFPNDYRTSDRDEGLLKPVQNCTSMWIDWCKSLGLVSNCIVAPPALVKKVMVKSGEKTTH